MKHNNISFESGIFLFQHEVIHTTHCSRSCANVENTKIKILNVLKNFITYNNAIYSIMFARVFEGNCVLKLSDIEIFNEI